MTSTNPYADNQNPIDTNSTKATYIESSPSQQDPAHPMGLSSGGNVQPNAHQANPAYPAFYPQPQEDPEGKSKAATALVLGILSIVFSGAGIPALVMGPLAMSNASKAARRGVNASAGKITGLIGLILGVFGALYRLFVKVVVIATTTSDPTIMC